MMKIDVEVVVQFVDQPNNAYGFQLRNDDNEPARRGMLDLLRDGFNNGWTVWIDYNAPPGHNNGVAMRVWLTKPTVQVTVGQLLGALKIAGRPA